MGMNLFLHVVCVGVLLFTTRAPVGGAIADSKWLPCQRDFDRHAAAEFDPDAADFHRDSGNLLKDMVSDLAEHRPAIIRAYVTEPAHRALQSMDTYAISRFLSVFCERHGGTWSLSPTGRGVYGEVLDGYLGSGSFSHVFKLHHHSSGKEVVVKFAACGKNEDPMHELRMLRVLHAEGMGLRVYDAQEVRGGILVRSNAERHPSQQQNTRAVIIAMGVLDTPATSFVRDILHSEERLTSFKCKVHERAEALRASGYEHGDLHLGNVGLRWLRRQSGDVDDDGDDAYEIVFLDAQFMRELSTPRMDQSPYARGNFAHDTAYFDMKMSQFVRPALKFTRVIR